MTLTLYIATAAQVLLRQATTLALEPENKKARELIKILGSLG